MAEEKIDGLEVLDDFDDDFGEQLDSFMESDDDDSEDAEDKIDKGNNNDDDDDDDDDDDLTEEEVGQETEEKNAEKVKEKKEKKTASAKGFPLKATIISSISGLILGAITIAVLYFLAIPSKTPLPEAVVELSNKMMIVKKKAKLAIEKMKDTKVRKAKPKGTKPKTKKSSYLIQVISCISQECVDESRLQLSSLGLKSRVRSTSVSSGIAEVLSSKVLGDEDSAIMVKKINSNNPLAGHAYRKSVKNGFLVSLGMFPDLETANRVRTYLNQAFKKQIFFNIQRSTQKIRYQKIQIGGFNSKKNAENLSNRLKLNNPDFQGAFVISAVKH